MPKLNESVNSALCLDKDDETCLGIRTKQCKAKGDRITIQIQ